jgi:transposase-like protein
MVMGRRTFTAEQIIFKLREVEVLVGQGERIANACRKIAVTEQTYYRWRREYGGMGTEQLKSLKELERENARLKRVVADLSLEKAILAEAAKGNFQAPPVARSVLSIFERSQTRASVRRAPWSAKIGQHSDTHLL